MEQVGVKVKGRGCGINILGVWSGPVDQLLHLNRILATIGGIDLMRQGHSAGLFLAADQDTKLAVCPEEIAFQGKAADDQGQDQGEGRRQEKIFFAVIGGAATANRSAAGRL